MPSNEKISHKEQQMQRYLRQILFEPFGNEGQQRLAQSRVLICGCGALGGNIAQTLVRAGIGFIRIIDNDTVSIDNLHRQFLFNENDAKKQEYKVIAAQRTLRAANVNVMIDAIVGRVGESNIDQYTADVDLLLDGTDNFPTRFLLNQAAVCHKIPFIWGGVTGTSGQMMTVLPGETPCLACLLDESFEKPTPSIFSILSPIVQVVSAFQASEAIKLLSGQQETTCRKLVSFDLWQNQIHQIALEPLKKEYCNVCGKSTDCC